MTNTPVTDLVAAIQWLKTKHAANRYNIDYMAECAAHEDHGIAHMETILKAVVSGTLTPTSAEPVALKRKEGYE